MKFLAHIDRAEGQVLGEDAMLSWGKVHAYDGKVLSKYFRFTTPFTVFRQYFCPSGFQTRVGDCHWTVIYSIQAKTGKHRLLHAWHPCS